jgi:membrane-associated protease RseP (regulator of RpoE activity)
MSAGPPVPPSLAFRTRRHERWWLHALLLLLTFGTTTFVGANFAVSFRPSLLPPGGFGPGQVEALVTGALSFSLPLLAILLAHEMGHYLMCRRYGIDASPPYFIPFPTLVGTMGAFIRIREPIRDKRQLFDVGVAGPIAGFVVALPLLVWGILHSRPNFETLLEPGTILFRYPLAVTWVQKLALGHTFTSEQAVEHPVFVAAWFGLFVTALNLLPLGQLDGGHALYAVFGKRQKTVAIPILGALALLGLKWPGWWLWVVVTLVIGIRHPPVIDEEIPLDGRRLAVAGLVLLMFLVCFAPVPIVVL